MLNLIQHGTQTGAPSLLIVHGLYGSARNWGVIAKRLSDEREVVAVDLRNHGDSPWFDSHSYFDMAADLAEVIEAHGAPMDVMGHSMGGKAAMVLALTRPDLLRKLVVADIAPVTYGHTQSQFIRAMKSVDLSQVNKRSDAHDQLAASVEDSALRSFFTQSLDVSGKRWKLNLDVLEQEMPKVLAFPEIDGSFDGPTLFLSGANSDYVTRDSRGRIRELFSDVHFAKLPDAGHWLHAERPRAFEAAMRVFLNA